MKAKYRLFRRGKIFYAENATTGKQQSLHTSDTQEAKRLIAAKNEAVNNAQLTLAVGKAYLAVTDPEMLKRTWFEVIGFVERRGGESTQGRSKRAFQSTAFDRIRNKAILETTAADFLSVLSDGRQSTSHYLKLLHSAAMDLGWLAGRPILARKCWPKITPKPKRSITWDEHLKIVSAERNQERVKPMLQDFQTQTWIGTAGHLFITGQRQTSRPVSASEHDWSPSCGNCRMKARISQS